jgi:hypothetical protein
MDELAQGCLGIALVLCIVGVVIYFAIVLVGLTLAYLGMTLIIPLDFFARSFTWVGVKSPAVGWFVLGCLTGGVIGLVQGLKRAGRKSDVPKVCGGAAALAFVLLLASSAARPPAHTFESSSSSESPSPSPSDTPPQSSSSVSAKPDVIGTWQGTFSNDPATLTISRTRGDEFFGTLSVQTREGTFRISVRGYAQRGTRDVALRELRIISEPKPGRWSLGKNYGTFASNGQQMSGTG